MRPHDSTFFASRLPAESISESPGVVEAVKASTHLRCRIRLSLAILLISAGTVTAEDYTYETNNGAITITGYTGPGGRVDIPARITGWPVTTIGQMAFRDCSTVTRIRLPEGVTTISDWGFWNCTGLEDVEVPQSLTTIGGHAFYSCIQLGSFEIPRQVTTIAPRTFGDCIRLERVSVPDGVTSIGEGAFGGTGLTNIILPNSVSDLGDLAFWYCTNLSNVTLSGGLTTIASMTFFNCTALTQLVIPSGVNSIQDKAFENCENLAAVYFRGNAPMVEAEAFANASQATVYWLPGTVGWTDTFGGRPTTRWVLPYPVLLNFPPAFGVQNDRFGFRISWATNAAVVVEAGPGLNQPAWSPVSTNTLVDGWSEFRDPESANDPSRFYRVRQW